MLALVAFACGVVDAREPPPPHPVHPRLAGALTSLDAGNPRRTTELLFGMRPADAGPGASTVEYTLGLAFEELGLPRTAELWFEDVLDRGPEDRLYPWALERVALDTRVTGDLGPLEGRDIPSDRVPQTVNDDVAWVRARGLYEAGRLGAARTELAAIEAGSHRAIAARYLEGVIFSREYKLKSSLKAFIASALAVRAENGERVRMSRQRELDRSFDLALLGITRLLYGIERFDFARRGHLLVAESSPLWAQAQLEAAWADFMLDQPRSALDRAASVERHGAWVPEATVLRAVVLFGEDTSAVDGTCWAFIERTTPAEEALRALVALPTAERWGAFTAGSGLPGALLDAIRADGVVTALGRRMRMIDEELAKIDGERLPWKDTVGRAAKRALAEERRRIERRAGARVGSEAERAAAELRDLRAQCEILRFEAVDAMRSD